MRNDITPISPSAYVSYAVIPQFINEFVLVEKRQESFKSEKEFIYYLTHQVNNKKNKNGRIYMKIDENGLLYANSVSPYSETFLDNIEPGIKNLVNGLINKRYLTYSSCEGHGNSFRRYVGLAFADKESRSYVKQSIDNLNIWGVKTRELSSVINQNIEMKANSKQINYKEKFDPEKQDNTILKEKEVNTFNIQFHRNYEEYHFLEIIILEEIPLDKSFWKSPFYNTFLIFMKKYFWDKQTEKITKAINSKEFKSYRY